MKEHISDPFWREIQVISTPAYPVELFNKKFEVNGVPVYQLSSSRITELILELQENEDFSPSTTQAINQWLEVLHDELAERN